MNICGSLILFLLALVSGCSIDTVRQGKEIPLRLAVTFPEPQRTADGLQESRLIKNFLLDAQVNRKIPLTESLSTTEPIYFPEQLLANAENRFSSKRSLRWFNYRIRSPKGEIASGSTEITDRNQTEISPIEFEIQVGDELKIDMSFFQIDLLMEGESLFCQTGLPGLVRTWTIQQSIKPTESGDVSLEFKEGGRSTLHMAAVSMPMSLVQQKILTSLKVSIRDAVTGSILKKELCPVERLSPETENRETTAIVRIPTFSMPLKTHQIVLTDTQNQRLIENLSNSQENMYAGIPDSMLSAAYELATKLRVTAAMEFIQLNSETWGLSRTSLAKLRPEIAIPLNTPPVFQSKGILSIPNLTDPVRITYELLKSLYKGIDDSTADLGYQIYSTANTTGVLKQKTKDGWEIVTAPKTLTQNQELYWFPPIENFRTDAVPIFKLKLVDGQFAASEEIDALGFIPKSNTAPRIKLSMNSVSISEDEYFVFSASESSGFSVFDDESKKIKVVLKVDHGNLQLNTLEGLDVEEIEIGGTFVIKILGHTAIINAAFDGLRYTPKQHFFGDDEFTILVSDIDPLSPLEQEQKISIAIESVADVPVDIQISNNNVDENSISNSFVGEISTLDYDPLDTFQYTLSGTDSSLFTLTGNRIYTNSVFDFEYKSEYVISLVSKDSANLTISKPFTIYINNKPEAPTHISISSNSINENSPAGTLIGTLSTLDPDASEAFSYTLGGFHASSFNLVGNELRTSVVFDYETSSTRTIFITARDTGNLLKTQTFTINVLNINESPTDITLSSTSIDEGLSSGTVVGVLGTIDEDSGDVFTYTILGTDAASFSISGHQLLSNTSFNYHSNNSYSITIRTTDSASNTREKDFVISIVNMPALSHISDQHLLEDSHPFQIHFAIEDADTASTTCSDVQVESTNSELFPSDHFTVTTHSGLNCLLSLRPAFNKHGESDITLNVTIDSKPYSTSFFAKVAPVHDAPTLSYIGPQQLNNSSDISQSIQVNFTISDGDGNSNIGCSNAFLTYSASIPIAVDLTTTYMAAGGTDIQCRATLSSTTNTSGVYPIKFQVRDNEGITSARLFSLYLNSGSPTYSSQVYAQRVTGLQVSLQGTCDPSFGGQHTVSSTLGIVRSVQCTAANGLSIELHLPAGGAPFFVQLNQISGSTLLYSTGVTIEREPFHCPAGYIGIPASKVPGLGSSQSYIGHPDWWLDAGKDFCIMKFPAKQEFREGRTVAVSRPEGVPWTGLERGSDGALATGAVLACREAGDGARLMSNMHWQTIARNAENIGSNWSGGSAGNGAFARGHTDASPNYIIDHPTDSNPYYRSGNDAASGWEQRRTKFLSNGEIIWDIGGNVAQYVSDSVYSIAASPSLTLSTPSLAYFSNTTYFSTSGLTAFRNLNVFGPSMMFSSSAILLGNSDEIVRGGSYIDSSWGGAFGASLNQHSANTYTGFRCAAPPSRMSSGSSQFGWHQEAYIKAVNSGAYDHFGASLSFWGDLLAVGATQEDSNQSTITNGSIVTDENSISNSGATYVYRRSGQAWVQEGYIKAFNLRAEDQYGTSVSIDQETLAVGVPGDDANLSTITNFAPYASPNSITADNSASESGAVHIYRKGGSGWYQEAYVKSSNSGAGDGFGLVLALFGDTLAVGAPLEDSSQSTISTTANDDNSLTESGAVYIYRRNGSNWVFDAYIKPSLPGMNEKFGSTLALTSEFLAVGATGEDSYSTIISNGSNFTAPSGSLTDSGAVYVFRKNGNIWQQDAHIKAANASASQFFGTKLSISGSTLAVGVANESSNQTTITTTPASNVNDLTSSGAVYVYRRQASGWAQEAFIKAINAGSYDRFGDGLALKGDTLVVGAPGEGSNFNSIINGPSAQSDNSLLNSGAVYVYKRTNDIWTQEAFVKSTNPDTDDLFGSVVAISGDSFAVSSAGEDSNQYTITNGGTASLDNTSAQSGAVYVYRNASRVFNPDVRIVNVTSNSVTFVWNSNSLGSANTIKIAPAAYSSNPVQDCNATGHQTVSSETFTYTGLTHATRYGFRFCGFNPATGELSEGALIWGVTAP